MLVTGIGGNVGQGILRNIARSGYPVRTIGTNIQQVSSGNHLCDEVYVVPYAYESGYIRSIGEICAKEAVDLIIPSTDYEAVYLTAGKRTLPRVASSPAKVNKTGLDKYATYLSFMKHGIPFAESMLPSFYDGRFRETVVKPREGRGSKGVVVNPTQPAGYPDTYIIQKLYTGTELTTAFYVTRQGKLHAVMTFVRDLYAGMTQRASVTTEYDDRIREIVKMIVGSLPVRASVNIQSIASADGDIIPFEMNTRVSGTNSIRSHFGFDDVRWILDEYLYGKKLTKPVLTAGSAHRIVMDVIYPGIGIGEMRNKRTKHFIF